MSRRPGRVFVLSAPSGAGKSTLVRELRRQLPALAYSVSLTTRPPRAGEVDGRDYHFVSREEFARRVAAGEMAEWAEVFGNRYGTSKRVLAEAVARGADVLLEIDVQGAAQIRRNLPGAVLVFLLPPSREELERRLRGRGSESEETLARRLAEAERELAEAAWFDHRVVNDDLGRAVAEVRAIITAGREA